MPSRTIGQRFLVGAPLAGAGARAAADFAGAGLGFAGAAGLAGVVPVGAGMKTRRSSRREGSTWSFMSPGTLSGSSAGFGDGTGPVAYDVGR